MKQTRLKAKEFNNELEQAGYSIQFSKKDAIERIEDKITNLNIIAINKIPSFFYHQNKLIPTIKFLHTQKAQTILKTVMVDMGAVKFVVSGADIMRPGITEIDQGIAMEEPVAVIDQKNKMVICVGLALIDTNEMLAQQKGKSVQNIHCVGDDIWKFN